MRERPVEYIDVNGLPPGTATPTFAVSSGTSYGPGTALGWSGTALVKGATFRIAERASAHAQDIAPINPRQFPVRPTKVECPYCGKDNDINALECRACRAPVRLQ